MNALELQAIYVGQTAPKVINTVRAAMGGVLFLDEAYSLAGGDAGGGAFKNEASKISSIPT